MEEVQSSSFSKWQPEAMASNGVLFQFLINQGKQLLDARAVPAGHQCRLGRTLPRCLAENAMRERGKILDGFSFTHAIALVENKDLLGSFRADLRKNLCDVRCLFSCSGRRDIDNVQEKGGSRDFFKGRAKCIY